MILTVCLNPAVDKTCELGSLQPGEVNRLTKSVSVAGGKGINVAKVLRQFHISVGAVGFLGGRSGEMIEESMEKLGVECYFTHIEGDTRTNVNLLGADGKVTELLEPGPEISAKELARFHKQFTGCLERCEMVVLSGSVPAGVPTDIYAQLIEECHRYGCRVILDTSGEPLREGLTAVPDVIKPNKKELEYLAGRELGALDVRGSGSMAESRCETMTENEPGDMTEMKAEISKLLAGGIGKVVLSLGAEGLLYMDKEQELFQPAKKVRAVNTVGCGDTVVASLCMSELSGEDADIALQKAAALAAANALEWESGKFKMQDYLELL